MVRRHYPLHDDRLPLELATARNLMTANPRSIDQSSTVRQAAEFLSAAGLSGAPVIDEAGRPVGVISRTDLLRHLGPGIHESADLKEAVNDRSGRAATPIHRIMTRAVFSVRPDTPAMKVIAKLTALEVGRLFVVDTYGVLLGVVSAFDLLRSLADPGEPATFSEADASDELTSHALAL
jgi:CBS domain-containing protein